MNEDFLNMRNVNPTSDPTGGYFPENEIKTQASILESRTVLDGAIRKLQLEGKSYPAGLSRVSAWRGALRLPASPAVQSDQVLQQAANGIKV